MIVKMANGYASFPSRTTVQFKTEPDYSPDAAPLPRLLVIDTDELFLQFILQALASHFQVSIAHDPAEALRRCRRHDFDLVVVDLGAPGCDGVRMLEEIYSNHRLNQIPLLALCTSPDLRKRIGRSDLIAIVPKPYWLLNLIETVNLALRGATEHSKEDRLSGKTQAPRTATRRIPSLSR